MQLCFVIVVVVVLVTGSNAGDKYLNSVHETAAISHVAA